jgi:hypothetical protein
MTVSNALNMASAGIPTMSTAGVYTASTTTEHYVQVGGSANNLVSVAPSTSGYVLTSNGASSDPSFQAVAGANGLSSVSITLTNSQIKNLRATPIQLIAAPGANKIIMPVGNAWWVLNYGGTSAFTGTNTIGVYFNNAAGTPFIGTPLMAAFEINSTANLFGVKAGVVASADPAVVTNYGIYAVNLGGSEIGGNAANDNTITLAFSYMVLS